MTWCTEFLQKKKTEELVCPSCHIPVEIILNLTCWTHSELNFLLVVPVILYAFWLSHAQHSSRGPHPAHFVHKIGFCFLHLACTMVRRRGLGKLGNLFSLPCTRRASTLRLFSLSLRPQCSSVTTESNFKRNTCLYTMVLSERTSNSRCNSAMHYGQQAIYKPIGIIICFDINDHQFQKCNSTFRLHHYALSLWEIYDLSSIWKKKHYTEKIIGQRNLVSYINKNYWQT